MNARILLSFAGIYLIWGSTFMAIKWGLESFPPFMLAGLRFFLAGLFFLLITKGKGWLTIKGADRRREMLIGVFLTIGNAGVCWAEQYISSGIASLVVGAVPVLFILFNWFSFEKKTPSISSIAGFGMGMTGITLISLDTSGVSDWRAILALLIANCSWVIGSLLMRATKTQHAYFPRASVQLIAGGGFNLLLSFLAGEQMVSWESLSTTGILSIAYLAFAGTVLAYTCYSFLLKVVRPEITSTYALVNPLIAILLGVFWMQEPFTMKVAIASLLVLGSVFLVLYGDRFVPVRVPVNK